MSLSVSSHNNKLFDDYFSEIYKERWLAIKESLTRSEKQVLRQNQFTTLVKPNAETCLDLKNCFWKPDLFKLEKNPEGLMPFYIMDPASIFVALALETQPDENILDLCAAPGGKTLIIAEATQSTGQLIANEYSESRREKLMRVLHEYIPKDKRLFIQVKGLDGNQYGLRYPEGFDRILADVPCSGERHLLENREEFQLWTKRRTQNLAVRQYSLLSSAWFALKKEGRLVYSTCSISPEENDQVVAKLLKKRKPEILRPKWLDSFEFIERTQHGYQILPDKSGFGPMYFSVLQKI